MRRPRRVPCSLGNAFPLDGGCLQLHAVADSAIRQATASDSERFRSTPGNFAVGGGFKADKLKYYDGPVPDEFVLREGDLVVTMTDLSKQSDTLGYPAFVPRSVGGRRYLHNQRIGKVVFKDTGSTDKRFLHYLLCSAAYRNEVLASATGTTVKHTAPERIGRFQFDRPPHLEQRAIAHILGALDDKIELNRCMNETLEAMARALFKSWFVNFDPVRAKNEGRDPGLPKEIADLFPDRFEDSKLGEIPAGWEVESLDAIADYQNGLALQNCRPADGEDRLPVVKIAQLRSGQPNSGEWAAATIRPECIIDDGDIVFSWSGSLIVKAWCGGRAALNQHLFKVTSTRFPKWFYFHCTLAHLPDFQRIAADKATTMGHIKRHHLREATCVIPSDRLLSAAGSTFATVLERIITVSVENRTLAALRDTLLPKLISGEVRVKDAERFIGSRTP